MVYLKNISKIYGLKETKKQALRNINLMIETSETVAITGKSGSGKTTLLNLIGVIDSPTEGELYIDGERLTHRKDKFLAAYRRKYIGFIFQFFYLLPELSVWENMLLPLRLGHQKIDRKGVITLAEQLEIEDKLQSYPEKLSGGQKQRVAIGRALLHKPKLILADEPTGNLDTKSAEKVIDLLLECVKEYQGTLIMVTHDKDMANKMEREINIQDGNIIFDTKDNDFINREGKDDNIIF